MGIRLTDLPVFWLVLAGLCLLYGAYLAIIGVKRSRGEYIPFFNELFYIWLARIKGEAASKRVRRKYAENQKWNRSMAVSAIVSAIGSVVAAVIFVIFAFLLSKK